MFTYLTKNVIVFLCFYYSIKCVAWDLNAQRSPSVSVLLQVRNNLLKPTLAAVCACSVYLPSKLVTAAIKQPIKIVNGEEKIMRQKSHGSSDRPVQKKLRWRCNRQLADRICNYNRRFAEPAGYFASPAETTFLTEEIHYPMKFFDSVTGLQLFTAPVGRSYEEWKKESLVHGWPSFRDNEVNWDYVRILPNGEMVSVTGTHLGHNLPDRLGNRYCINLVSIAGYQQQDFN